MRILKLSFDSDLFYVDFDQVSYLQSGLDKTTWDTNGDYAPCVEVGIGNRLYFKVNSVSIEDLAKFWRGEITVAEFYRMYPDTR